VNSVRCETKRTSRNKEGITPYVDEMITVNFGVIDQLLIRYSTFVRYRGKTESIMGTVQYSYISRRLMTQERSIV
jgi:hypothetical protein